MEGEIRFEETLGRQSGTDGGAWFAKRRAARSCSAPGYDATLHDTTSPFPRKLDRIRRTFDRTELRKRRRSNKECVYELMGRLDVAHGSIVAPRPLFLRINVERASESRARFSRFSC